MVKAHFQTFEKYRKLKEENYAIALPTRNYHYIHSFLFTLGFSEYLIFFFFLKEKYRKALMRILMCGANLTVCFVFILR